MSSVAQKILIVGPAWIGDMVMSQSLFKLIKQRQPNACIDVLAPAWSQPLLACMPEVNRAFVAPFQHGELLLLKRYALARELKTNHYDQAIVLPNSLKSALIPFFAKIPQRTGWRGEMRWGLLNDIRYLDKTKMPLMVQQLAALGLSTKESLPENLPRPALQISQNIEAIKKRFNLMNDRPILILCPGAEYGSAKRWPAEYFAATAQAKLQAGWQVWLLGSDKDRLITDIIQQAAPGCINLAGKTSLADAIALLSLAQAVISNDSGLMHIAAALNKPLVVIYGSSSPKFTPPLTERVKILSLNLTCSPCFSRECPLGHFRCMKDLKSTLVLQALDQLLAA